MLQRINERATSKISEANRRTTITDVEINARIVPASARWPDLTTPAWADLRSCVEALKLLVRSVDDKSTSIEQNTTLSPKGIQDKRTEVGRAAINELANYKPLNRAETSVRTNIEKMEARMVNLPSTPTDVADVAMAEEIRAHVASQSSPFDFVMQRLSDARVLGAVLNAPAFLSKLTDVQMNIVRDRARQALHPEQSESRKKLEEALEHVSNGVVVARRMILQRTETRIDRDGQVRGIREPEPGGAAA